MKTLSCAFALLALSSLGCEKKADPTATAPSATASAPPPVVEVPDAEVASADAGIDATVSAAAKTPLGTGGLSEADYEEAAINEINASNMDGELAKIEKEISQ